MSIFKVYFGAMIEENHNNMIYSGTSLLQTPLGHPKVS